MSNRGPDTVARVICGLKKKWNELLTTSSMAKAMNRFDDLQRCSKGFVALPHGRASDTFCFGSILRLTLLLICLSLFFQPIAIFAQSRAIATITIDTSHPVNRFTPSQALGAAIDGHEKGTNDLQLTAANINAMLSAGFKSLTYRLRTELGGDVWHWNPNGTWSNARNHEGYWVSESKLGPPISLSYGYH